MVPCPGPLLCGVSVPGSGGQCRFLLKALMSLAMLGLEHCSLDTLQGEATLPLDSCRDRQQGLLSGAWGWSWLPPGPCPPWPGVGSLQTMTS